MNRKALLLKLLFCGNGVKRAKFIKKHDVFYAMGEHCYWHSAKIPNETYLMNIHNNVVVAANVTFLTHDLIEFIFNDMGEYKQYIGSIEIFDNCFIGANSTILYNVKIGPKAIVAAGSVVTKDVPEGTIVGGNPARVIGKFDDLKKKRKCLNYPTKEQGIDRIAAYFWNENKS